MKEMVLVGGGIHSKSVIGVIEAENKYKIAGIIDDDQNKVGQKILGYEIMANSRELPELVKRYKYYHITIGHIHSPQYRIDKYEYIKSLGGEFPIIISPLTWISRHSSIGEGSIIMHNSMVDAEAHLGKHCIINFANTIAHKAYIGDWCHVSANCVLGDCRIGWGTFIGCNCFISNGVTIPERSLIGSGTNVVKSLPDSGIYAGNPARLLKKTSSPGKNTP